MKPIMLVYCENCGKETKQLLYDTGAISLWYMCVVCYFLNNVRKPQEYLAIQED